MTVLDAAPHGAADRSAATTVYVSGEIDIFASPSLREFLLGTLQASTGMLVLNLSGVSSCDASGLAVLVGIQRRASSMGITLAMTAPRPYLSRLFRLTGLDRTLPLAARPVVP